MSAHAVDRACIEAVLPHRGAMCLIDAVLDCDGDAIRCISSHHRDPAHPLRDDDGLGMANAVEFAAQAMALHAAIGARAGGPAARAEAVSRLPAGRVASVRDLRLAAGRLDEAAAPLEIEARCTGGDARQATYAFSVRDGERVLASGRALVLIEVAPVRRALVRTGARS